MVKHYLDFEKPLIEIETEMENLRRFSGEKRIPIEGQMKALEEKLHRLQKEVFSNLTPWQVTQLARHIDRPKASFYVGSIFEHFIELHGDRPTGMIRRSSAEFRDLTEAGRSHRPSKGGGCQGNGLPKLRHASPGGISKALRLMTLGNCFENRS